MPCLRLVHLSYSFFLFVLGGLPVVESLEIFLEFMLFEVFFSLD